MSYQMEGKGYRATENNDGHTLVVHDSNRDLFKNNNPGTSQPAPDKSQDASTRASYGSCEGKKAETGSASGFAYNFGHV
jgi:hypothetical protein